MREKKQINKTNACFAVRGVLLLLPSCATLMRVGLINNKSSIMIIDE